MQLDEAFWAQRYELNQTGWNLGYPSTPIKEYIDQLENKELPILIPGAGNAYEAEYLFNAGFQNTFVIDLSLAPLKNLKDRVPAFPEAQLIHGNFFNHKGQYDLIIEQTFFCALDPSLRNDYVNHMSELLRPGGKLAGLLFDAPMYDHRPPYGGKKEDYKKLLSIKLNVINMEPAYNSIESRAGNEVFFIAQKSA